MSLILNKNSYMICPKCGTLISKTLNNIYPGRVLPRRDIFIFKYKNIPPKHSWVTDSFTCTNCNWKPISNFRIRDFKIYSFVI